MQDGADALWGDIPRHKGMLDTMMNVHSIELTNVDFISIIRIEREDFCQRQWQSTRSIALRSKFCAE